MTNIFPRPSAAVPASSTFAVFAVLNLAHKMNIGTVKSLLVILFELIDQEVNLD